MNLRWHMCVLLVVAGCGSKVASTQRSVGPDGGQVTIGDGASINIPPGALPSAAVISVTATNAPPPTDTVAVGTPYLFGPEGTQFAQPVTITLAFVADLLPADTSAADVAIYTAPAGTTSYEALPTTLADDTHVQATTTHFSIFLPAVNHNKHRGNDLSVGNDSDLGDGIPDLAVASVPDLAAMSLADMAVAASDMSKNADMAGACAQTYTSTSCQLSGCGGLYTLNCIQSMCQCYTLNQGSTFFQNPATVGCPGQTLMQMVWTTNCKFP